MVPIMTAVAGIVASAGAVQPAPSFRSFSTARTTSGTANNNPGLPTGAASTDVLLALVGIDSGSDTVAVPSGWSLIHGPVRTTGGAPHTGYLMTAPGNVASTTFVKTGTDGPMRVNIGAYAGARWLDGSSASASSVNGSTILTDAIQTTANNTLAVVAFTYSSTGSATAPSGWTERYESTNSGAPCNATADKVIASPSSIGDDPTISISTGWVGFLVAIAG
jgi:hypothetical protein